MAKKFTLLQTPRLVLRPIVLADWPAIHRYMSDPIVTRWLPEGLLDEAQAQAFAQKNAGRSARAVAVIERESNQLVGHMVFHPWFGRATHTIGWAIASGHQGRGYATEAARTLMDFAFSTLGCHRMVATCQPENAASWRVLRVVILPGAAVANVGFPAGSQLQLLACCGQDHPASKGRARPVTPFCRAPHMRPGPASGFVGARANGRAGPGRRGRSPGRSSRHARSARRPLPSACRRRPSTGR